MKVVVVHILAQCLGHGPVALGGVHDGGENVLLTADDLDCGTVRIFVKLLGEIIAAVIVEVGRVYIENQLTELLRIDFQTTGGDRSVCHHLLKHLGMRLGFPEKSADVRLAQYETGTRTPKAEITQALANEFGVSPLALAVPDIDSYQGLMHTLFTLEDRYGLKVVEYDGEVHLRVDVFNGKDAAELSSSMIAWREQAAKLEAGEITKEEYDRWRYRYPEFDTTRRWVKVPDQRFMEWLLSDMDKDKE